MGHIITDPHIDFFKLMDTSIARWRMNLTKIMLKTIDNTINISEFLIQLICKKDINKLISNLNIEYYEVSKKNLSFSSIP